MGSPSELVFRPHTNVDWLRGMWNPCGWEWLRNLRRVEAHFPLSSPKGGEAAGMEKKNPVDSAGDSTGKSWLRDKGDLPASEAGAVNVITPQRPVAGANTVVSETGGRQCWLVI